MDAPSQKNIPQDMVFSQFQQGLARLAEKLENISSLSKTEKHNIVTQASSQFGGAITEAENMRREFRKYEAKYIQQQSAVEKLEKEARLPQNVGSYKFSQAQLEAKDKLDKLASTVRKLGENAAKAGENLNKIQKQQLEINAIALDRPLGKYGERSFTQARNRAVESLAENLNRRPGAALSKMGFGGKFAGDMLTDVLGANPLTAGIIGGSIAVNELFKFMTGNSTKYAHLGGMGGLSLSGAGSLAGQSALRDSLFHAGFSGTMSQDTYQKMLETMTAGGFATGRVRSSIIGPREGGIGELESRVGSLAIEARKLGAAMGYSEEQMAGLVASSQQFGMMDFAKKGPHGGLSDQFNRYIYYMDQVSEAIGKGFDPKVAQQFFQTTSRFGQGFIQMSKQMVEVEKDLGDTRNANNKYINAMTGGISGGISSMSSELMMQRISDILSVASNISNTQATGYGILSGRVGGGDVFSAYQQVSTAGNPLSRLGDMIKTYSNIFKNPNQLFTAVDIATGSTFLAEQTRLAATGNVSAKNLMSDFYKGNLSGVTESEAYRKMEDRVGFGAAITQLKDPLQVMIDLTKNMLASIVHIDSLILAASHMWGFGARVAELDNNAGNLRTRPRSTIGRGGNR